METQFCSRNKWEDQRIKKKNRKTPSDHGPRQSSNSIHKHFSYNGRYCKREIRMTHMKYDKEICNDYQGYHHIDECSDDVLIANQHNVIPIWICSCCTYRNIERKSICSMCFSSYSSNIAPVIDDNKDKPISTAITLGEFCKDVWDELQIPVWICGVCTYCNVKQLPQCQMCDNSYYSTNNETMSDIKNDENFDEIYEEFAENQENDDEIYLCDDIQQNVIEKDNANVSEKSKQQQFYVTVTMKLIENKLYQKTRKMKLVQKNEDVVRYTLLQCQLNVSANDELIQSYPYIPSTKHYDKYCSNDSVIVPIRYKYRNKYGEFVGYPKNFPLQTVCEFIWKSQYPSFDKIESPQWNIRYPDHKDMRSPAEKHEIFDVILQFIPLGDIINSILFPYLGYDNISVVKIWTTFHGNLNHVMTYSTNTGRFELYNTRYSTIKSRKINSDLKLIEIGFSNEYKKKRKNTRYNGYYGYRPSYGRRQLSYYMELKLAQFGRETQPNDYRRKLRHKRRKLSKPSTAPVMKSTSQWRRGYFPRRKSGFELKGSKNRRKQRARIESNVSKQVYLYKKWPIEVGYNRMNDMLDKRYSEKHKRYVQRKWSAYWKLVVE